MKKRFLYSAVILTLTGGMIGYSFRPVPSQDFEISKNIEIFGAIYKEINSFYVDETQPGTLMKEGIDAMLESLDPYTVYIPEADIEDYRFMTTGQYGGVGALIRTEGRYSVITEPYEGYPAHKAGLIAGDIILAIDGKSIEGKSNDEVSKFLKGQAGTKIELKIRREGTEDFTKELIREEIKIKDVPYYGMLDNKTGYIKLNSFTQTASAEVKKAFKDLKDTKGMQQLVFDLRGNGGGLLVESVNIVNMFVPKGQSIVTQKGRIPGSNFHYKATMDAMDAEMPLVILVDGGSASASEIVSGAIQDLDRGVIIGQRSYGKGLVQQTREIPFKSLVKLTVAKYYTPSGRCIQKLDYSHKDESGKATIFADSLLKKFKTKSGRDVYDGRGIDPDIKIEDREYSKLLLSLYSEHHIFNYATKFRREHESIASAGEFRFTEEQYKDFLNFLKDKEYHYSTASEKKYEELKTTAEKEKYFKDAEKEFDALIAKLRPNRNEDLLRFRDEITEFLESEIVTRYYYQTGRSIHSLKKDPYIDAALNILNNPAEYKRILTGPGKK
jgi:carboxyl-terminal processing protease